MSDEKPYLCPNCGANDWQADYYQAVRQGCTLVVGEDGRPYAEDYDGCEDSYDDGATEDDRFVCQSCEYAFTVGEWSFRPHEPKLEYPGVFLPEEEVKP